MKIKATKSNTHYYINQNCPLCAGTGFSTDTDACDCVKEEIFVFGSNAAGRHGKGAALFAKNEYGAETGVGEGRTGNAYAIPTKDQRLQTLPLFAIRYNVERFLHYATQNPKLSFKVTRIGCGLAGYKDAMVAMFFLQHPPNLVFDEKWREWVPTAKSFFKEVK